MDEEERMYSLPIYVPYSRVRSNRVSSVVSIIDSNNRVYIRERNRHNLHKVDDFKTQNEYGEFDSDEENDDDDTDKLKPKDSLGSLDLGIEPLRRIVLDMHRLHSEKPHFTFDQNSARAAGLPRYCDYLKGPKSNQPKSLNRLRLEAVQQKKKAKNIGKK